MNQRGQAVIETLLFGLLLLAPLVWTLGVLAEMHRSALAVSSAAREAGFDAARSNQMAAARLAVDEAVARAFRDHGIDPADARVRWSAAPGLPRGGAVEVEVSYPVTVLQAPFLGRVAGPSVVVRARHVSRIDPYRSR